MYSIIISKIASFSLIKLFFELIIEGLQQIVDAYGKFPRCYTMLTYLFISMAFCYYPIFDHWIAGFMMMSLPIAIIGGLIASSYLLIHKQKMIAAVGFIWLLMTFPIIKRMVGIGNGQVPTSSLNSLKVLSFNGECFANQPNGVTNWKSLESDIACLQEYACNDQLEAQYAHRMVKLTKFSENHQVGLALFSKYPIIKQYGRIWNRIGAPDINGFLCADIAYGYDTVRIVNTHLWSMGVRLNQATDALKAGEIKEFAFQVYDTFRRLKEGFAARNEQIKEIESYVTGSKYPVIICGDFNEIPFGYAYGKLSLSFNNAFEEVGQGMGFTLNRHPYCVRIDQQFFSADWQVQSCETLSNITISDHFPVVANYVLSKSEKNLEKVTLARR
jgi:endonuclease/exonuclease/phosphatase family metal-dependent hydrolase